MKSDTRDIVGGLLLMALGLFVAIYAATHYELGTLRRMQSGMFPLGAGAIMALMGGCTIIFADRKNAIALPAFTWRPAIFIVLGVVAFALGVGVLGMIPAIFLMVFVSAFSESGFAPLRSGAIAVVLSLVAFVVFSLTLNLPFEMVRWPL